MEWILFFETTSPLKHHKVPWAKNNNCQNHSKLESKLGKYVHGIECVLKKICHKITTLNKRWRKVQKLMGCWWREKVSLHSNQIPLLLLNCSGSLFIMKSFSIQHCWLLFYWKDNRTVQSNKQQKFWNLNTLQEQKRKVKKVILDQPILQPQKKYKQYNATNYTT